MSKRLLLPQKKIRIPNLAHPRLAEGSSIHMLKDQYAALTTTVRILYHQRCAGKESEARSTGQGRPLGRWEEADGGRRLYAERIFEIGWDKRRWEGDGRRGRKVVAEGGGRVDGEDGRIDGDRSVIARNGEE